MAESTTSGADLGGVARTASLRVVEWAWPKQATIADNAIRLAIGAMIVLSGWWAIRSVWYFIGVALARQAENLPTQWLEPLFYQSALRVYEGAPLYDAPSAAFIAPIYAPGLALGGGGLFYIFGPGFEPLRALSIGALLLLAIVAGLWAVRAAKSWPWFIVPPVLIIALDPPLNQWLTQINTDVPFLALTVLGLYLLHDEGNTRARAFAAGLCIAGATLFKQHGLVFAAGAFLPLIIIRPRNALAFAGGACAVLIPVFAWFQWQSDGWFWTVVVQIPLESTSKARPETIEKLRGLSAAGALAFAAATAVLAVIETKGRGLLWAGAATAAGYVTIKAFTKDGAGENNFLPVLVMGMVMVPVALAHLYRAVPDGRAKLAVVAAMFAILGVVGRYGFDSTRDRFRDIQRAQADGKEAPVGAHRGFEESLRDIIRTEAGEVFVGARPNLLWEEGREQNFHQTTLYEGTGRTSVYDLNEVVGTKLRQKEWKAMIVWDYGQEAFNKLLGTYYEKQKDLGRDPLIGLPVALWVPRK